MQTLIDKMNSASKFKNKDVYWTMYQKYNI